MRMTSLNSLLALAFVAAAGVASAQDYYLTGSLANPTWDPAATAPIGSGTHADMKAIANGSNLRVTLTSAQHGLTPGNLYEAKFTTGGAWANAIPSDNSYVVAPTAGDPLEVNIQVVAFGDGFLPEATGTLTDGVVYSNTTANVVASDTITIVGDLGSELGSADWAPLNALNPVLTDAGNGTTSDGIIGYTTTALPAGTWSFKLVRNASTAATGWENGAFGVKGFGGGNISFTTTSAGQTVVISLNSQGRYKVAVTGGPAIPAGYYASFDAVGPAFVAGELLESVNLNVYAKTFTIATAGAHTARVTQDTGTTFPTNASASGRGGAGSGYPFVTTAASQAVRVYLDRNTYADGFKPAADFIAVVADDASHSALNTFTQVYVVGGPQGEFLAGDTVGSEWLPNEFGMGLTGAGDVKTYTATPLAAGSGQEWKILARSADFPAATGWDSIEVGTQGLSVGIGGGANQTGITWTTSPFSFAADTKTGRVAPLAGSTAPVPTRPSYLTTNSAVQDWSLF